MPLQVVQAKPTIPKPSFSSSGSNFASSRYDCTAFEPGANDVLTQGLRINPLAFALRASKPAAITLRGLLVLVQLVIAAIIHAPSGIKPSSFSTTPDIPSLAKSLVDTRRCGFEGPAILRPTLDKSNLSTRSYFAVVKLSLQRPAVLA